MQLLDAGGQVPERPSPTATVAPGWVQNAGPPAVPTIADPDWANAVSAELSEFVTLSGQTLSKTNVAQVVTGALMLFGVHGADSGSTANEYVVAAPAGFPNLPSLADGQPAFFTTTRANTAAATLALYGEAATSILRFDGSGLEAGDIVAGGNKVRYRAGVSAFCLEAPPPPAVPGAAELADGQGILAYSNTTTALFRPRDGCNFVNGGVAYQLASAGVAIANSGVTVNGTSGQTPTPSTAYCLSMNFVTGVASWWQTGTYSHGPDTTTGNIGKQVITSGGTPMTNERFIGIVALSAAGLFYPLGIISWFNPQPGGKTGEGVYSTTRSTSSATLIEVNAENEVPFVSMTARETVFSLSGEVQNSGGSNSSCYVAIAIDGTAQSDLSTGMTPTGSPAQGMTIGIDGQKALSEGLHTASVVASVTASTIAFNGGAFSVGNTPVTLRVTIPG